MRERAGEQGKVTRGILLPLLLILSLSHLNAQTGGTLRLVQEAQPSRAQSLSITQINNTAGVPLRDLCSALGFSVRENATEGWLEARTGSRFLTFFANSPFYSSVEADSVRTRQLPLLVTRSQGVLYFPLVVAPFAFPDMFGVPATYNAAANTLTIGKPLPKSAFDITTLEIDQRANGVLIRIPASRPLTDYEGHLSNDGWYYFTVRNAKVDVANINKLKPVGSVKKIVAIQHSGSAQLTFRLDGKFAGSEILTPAGSNTLVISLRMPVAEGGAGVDEQRRVSIQADLERQRKRFELDVIVLDAGHGGKDPGTIGLSGTKEKDITLAIVLKLGVLIKKHMKDVKVVYTRDDDRFVELDRRGQIANEAGGKLFISVHCNAMPRKPHPNRGFEVYLLRPGRTDEAIAIAERENSVIQLEERYEERYKALTDENFILVTMAQTAHMRASELFAELATREMAKLVNTRNNGVKQAGFYVLVGASMPNVLVETAYLSNREDEAILRSSAGQQRIAEALFNAIKHYKREHEKLLKEGVSVGTR